MRTSSWLAALACLLLMLALGGCAPAATREPSDAAAPTDEPSSAQPTSAAEQPTPEATRPAPPAALAENRLIVLEWPAKMLEKDSDFIVLSLVMDENGQVTVTPETPGNTVKQEPVQIPDVYDTHTVEAVARLDMAGFEAWRDEIREPLLPGRPVQFRWSVSAAEAGRYKGVVWLHIEFIPKDGGRPERVTLLSRPIEIEAVTVLGMPGWLARAAGGVGLFASTVLGFPFVSKALENLPFLRRKGRKASDETERRS